MSAFIVPLATIDALVTAGLGPASNRLRWLWNPATDETGAYQAGSWCGPESHRVYQEKVHELTLETADAVGQMLVAQNVRSVNFRYDEDAEVEEYHWQRYNHRRDHGYSELRPVEVLSLINGYEYQACEDPGWRTSQAKAYCDALRDHLIRRLPGYDEGPWTVDERTPKGIGPTPMSELFRQRTNA